MTRYLLRRLAIAVPSLLEPIPAIRVQLVKLAGNLNGFRLLALPAAIPHLR
jgi:hypothetical protein